MKFFKNIICIVAFFVINATNARGGQATSSSPATSTPSPIVSTRATVPTTITYKTLLEQIRNNKLPVAVLDSSKMLSQDFIKFITDSAKASNLDATFVEALLQAGANLNAPLSGNDNDKQFLLNISEQIQKIMNPGSQQTQQSSQSVNKPLPPLPQRSSKPANKPLPISPPKINIQQPINAQESNKCRNLIILLDPMQKETISSQDRAMTSDLLLALQDGVAPIIVTNNVLKIIANIQLLVGNDDLQKLRTMIDTTTDAEAMLEFATELLTTHNLSNESPDDLALLSLVDFNTIQCYLHKSAALALLIPKNYIQKNYPTITNLNPNDQAKACGFNPAIITTMDISAIAASKQTQINPENVASAITAFFIPEPQTYVPEKQTYKWIIYLSGHGSASKSITTGMTGRIAGLNFSDFKKLIEFFNKGINTAYLHYNTCFGGGSNQTFVAKVLSSLNANFIVSAEGVDETSTFGNTVTFIPSSEQLILLKEVFSDFFKQLNLFIAKPEEFVKLKGKKMDPLVEILRTVVPDMTEANQPFVRFPGGGTFGALALDKTVKILTQAIVTAHELEKKSIDLSNTQATAVIIYPSRINVPLNLGTEILSIVSPTSKAASSNETFHLFKEINFEHSLQELLFALVYRNARFHTQTFVVKKLTGIKYQESGLPTEPNNDNAIHNLIVQIKGILGTNKNPAQEDENRKTLLTARDIKLDEMGGNVELVFELNGKMYQSLILVKNFEIGPDEEGLFNQTLHDQFEATIFTPQAPKDVDMNSVARTFMTPQEADKLTKPITLEIIANAINSKINNR